MAVSINNTFGFEKTSLYSYTGTAGAIVLGRISYVFDFKGPNASYDTACSSSLVTLDAVTSALNERGCDMVLVAGVNELFEGGVFKLLVGMLSPTGHCHTFDASADG